MLKDRGRGRLGIAILTAVVVAMISSLATAVTVSTRLPILYRRITRYRPPDFHPN
jgi:hypothetical protein